jgi:uncharacterized protein (UPF0254 family)
MEENDLREAASMARDFRDRVLTALRSGEGTPAMRRVLLSLDKDCIRLARAADVVANDLALLRRLNEGNAT